MNWEWRKSEIKWKFFHISSLRSVYHHHHHPIYPYKTNRKTRSLKISRPKPATRFFLFLLLFLLFTLLYTRTTFYLTYIIISKATSSTIKFLSLIRYVYSAQLIIALFLRLHSNIVVITFCRCLIFCLIKFFVQSFCICLCSSVARNIKNTSI